MELVPAVFINHMKSMEVILKHMSLALFVHASTTVVSEYNSIIFACDK